MKNINQRLIIYLKENNISGINGHRSVGGYRASIYNAMEIESIEVLSRYYEKI